MSNSMMMATQVIKLCNGMLRQAASQNKKESLTLLTVRQYNFCYDSCRALEAKHHTQRKWNLAQVTNIQCALLSSSTLIKHQTGP
jgi:hypothetical protein